MWVFSISLSFFSEMLSLKGEMIRFEELGDGIYFEEGECSNKIVFYSLIGLLFSVDISRADESLCCSKLS